MIVITAATGKFGHHAVEHLLRIVPASELAVAVRDPAKAGDFASRGVQVRRGDYDDPRSLEEAFRGADRLLFISGSEVGKRVPQHQAVVRAAKQAGVKLVAYTSILHGTRSTLALAKEHQATERELAQSGVPHVLLRNSWYFENYTGNLAPALEHGALFGCAGNGRISAAARADYAEAAAKAITSSGQEGKVYELAGDVPFTMSELAQELTRATGKTIVYKDLPQDEYAAVLVKAGLPPPAGAVYADADAGIARGELFDDSRQLSALLGRPTTSLRDAVLSATAPRPAGR